MSLLRGNTDTPGCLEPIKNMCWSNSLPSLCTSIPGASACCRGTAKLRASCSHQTCCGGATPDTLLKVQLLPLAVYYGGQQLSTSAWKPPEEKSSKSQSNVCEEKYHTLIWYPRRFPWSHRGTGSARFSLTLRLRPSHRIRIIWQFKSDN